MKSKRYEGDELRRVLSAMVMDSVVCNRVASQWNDEGLFDTPWANLVGGWCVDHIRKYGQSPNGQLKGIFKDWTQETTAGDDVITSVEKFLIAVSDQYEDEAAPNSEYMIDLAARYFNKIRMRMAIEEVTDSLDRNKIDEAWEKFITTTTVGFGVGALIKPAEDYEAWRRAFDAERGEQLISYPGRLDKFIGQWMTRDSFIAFMGADKSGKSMMLLDASYRACRSRRRVAYFECGDMGEEGVMLRLGQRATLRPRWKGKVQWPVKLDREGIVDHEIREAEDNLTPQQSYKAFNKACRGKDLFRLSVHANSTISIDGIRSVLADWEREKWVPDVVVIDYADILDVPKGIKDPLDQIDVTWKRMKRLNQELHCLVLTATQSKATAYENKSKYLSRKHFSGRKTKLAHIDGMIGINVSPEDQKDGIIRLNWVVRRRGQWDERHAEPVAGCLDVAAPVIKSREFS